MPRAVRGRRSQPCCERQAAELSTSAVLKSSRRCATLILLSPDKISSIISTQLLFGLFCPQHRTTSPFSQQVTAQKDIGQLLKSVQLLYKWRKWRISRNQNELLYHPNPFDSNCCYNINYLIKFISVFMSAPRLREIKTEATEDELWTFHCVFIFTRLTPKPFLASCSTEKAKQLHFSCNQSRWQLLLNNHCGVSACVPNGS